MTDPALKAIDDRTPRTVRFDWFRETFKADNGLWESLSRGRAVLDTVPKLDQYLYSYAPMIESQWSAVADRLATIDAPDRLIDYGCGQGLGGLLIDDLTDGELLDGVRDAVLIEPSAPALARAEAIYRNILPQATIGGVAKLFDALDETDVPATGARQTLHLFSNSLDVPGFRPLALFAKTLHAGRHTILAVSHDRDFAGGTPQIKAVKDAFDDPAPVDGITVTRSILEPFVFRSDSDGVLWLCDLEIDDG